MERFHCIRKIFQIALNDLIAHARLREGAFHLVKNSENPGSGQNGKRFFSVRPTGKFPEKVELLRR